MANNTRASIDSALFAQLQAASWTVGVSPATPATWAYTSMHFQDWATFDAGNQPAMFLRRIMEEISQTKAYGLNKYVFHYECWIYARTNNNDSTDNPYTDSSGSTVTVGLDTLIDAVDAAIAPNPAISRNNLGGLVDNCRLAGQILLADGTDNGQAVVRLPIQVFTGI